MESSEFHIDLQKTKSMKLEEWTQFFSNIGLKSYTKKATEQWDDETRAQLIERIESEVHDFM
jgi:hypothetical protein